ncbi:MAG: DUF2279 domain-containing protein [Gemmatimonadota bacterium]|nr:DUF2279 domain-containing protein [Gemmatimonadota bacterium]
MNRRLLCCVIASLAWTAPASAQAADSSRTPVASAPKDSFLGLDKPKHFLLSFFLESGSFAVIQAGGGSRGASFLGASAVTSAFGVGREIHDRRTKGLFSLGDLVWDAIGAGTAALMLRHTYR